MIHPRSTVDVRAVLALAWLTLSSALPSAAPAAAGHRERLFRPVAADPRETQFRMKYVRFEEDWRYGTDVTDSTSRGGVEHGRTGTAWDVAIGEAVQLDPRRRLFGRWAPWVRYQLGIPAGVFAQFDRAGLELINTDYQFGGAFDVLWSGRYEAGAGVTDFDRPVVTSRTMLYHRSTHVGDDYLAKGDFGRNQTGHPRADDLFHHPPVKIIELSYEAIRTVVSVEWSPASLAPGSTARVYAGGELTVNLAGRTPENFTSPVGQVGFEFRSAGNQDDPKDTWLTRLLNAPFRRKPLETEWFAAVDLKLARPYNFASCDNPTGEAERWTPHLWTECPHGREFRSYAGSWHAMAGFGLTEGSHRRGGTGGTRLAPEVLVTLDWYRGYSPNGQFLDQPLSYHALWYVVPGITVRF